MSLGATEANTFLDAKRNKQSSCSECGTSMKSSKTRTKCCITKASFTHNILSIYTQQKAVHMTEFNANVLERAAKIALRGTQLRQKETNWSLVQTIGKEG